MKPRCRVIGSIFQRNFASYFSGALGYLFIVVFVVAGGALAFNARFFTANQPTLDELTAWYPLLLLFFVPAVTMSVWADERKSGTDELLFTMPATDVEILLGKYLAVVAVYTVALLFSMTHVFVLMYLGNPDWGLLATTYLGYWIAGAALLSAGMLASSLTRSMTVAFVLGVLTCAIPVFIGEIGRLVGLGDTLASLSLREQFHDLGLGIIPLTSLLYFVCFTAFMLYLNFVAIRRRVWRPAKTLGIRTQYALRAVSLAVLLICFSSWFTYASIRVDATSEKLFSLSPVTNTILKDLNAERPIEIQAFISPEVPAEYVETKKRLLGLLRQFDDLGGNKLEVRYVDVEQYSQAAEEARHFGIEPVEVMTERDGRRAEVEVYLGAVVLSSFDKVVIPFFGKGLPLEYELSRAVQTVAKEDRHTIGILRTDAELIGGREWRIVTELKKQYKVEEVSPATAIDASRFDVLLAVLPSSLTEPEMNNLVSYVESGKPALIFDDPFPLSFNNGFGVTNAPRQPKPSAGGGMLGRGGPPPEQKADGGRATRLLDALGIRWQYDQVVFDIDNPHPEFGSLPPEYVFITRESADDDSFNPESPITRGLQEVIALYTGTVSRGDSNVRFDPLLRTSEQSGLLSWNEFVDEGGFNFFSMQQTASPRRNPFRTIDGLSHVIAARVQSDSDSKKVNAVYVADIDMISDFFFEERNLGNLDVEFDNVTFVLNAADTLIGDESFIDLRSRRARHRTLKRVEAQKRQFLEQANEAEQEADKEADEQLATRRTQLKKRAEEIEKDENLDPIAKAQMLQQAQQAEQQRLTLAEAQIEQRKNRQIGKIRAETNRKISKLESNIRLWAVLLPPLPALCLGLFVFASRWQSENRNVIDRRRRPQS